MCLNIAELNTPIADFLREYNAHGFLRLHMPGGMSNPSDITEIFGADSLYESSSIILKSEQNAAALFGSGGVCYSCSGSTLSIQAMLGFAKQQGFEKIAAGRYSHKSLVNTAILLGLEIEWLYPEKYLSSQVEMSALKSPCVFLTSVDYYGGECDIAAAAEHLPDNALLLVDNAHGAYKVFSGDHPITKGADLVADSAHKTLPVLTGGGYLHMKEPTNRKELKRQMSLFGTTSPSYLILESLDLCNLYVKNQCETALRSFKQVEQLKNALSKMGFALAQSDAMRITINARESGFTGFELAAKLREKFIECEMSDDTFLVLIFSAGVLPVADLIIRAFSEIVIKKRLPPKEHIILKPKVALPLREAFYKKSRLTPIANAHGRICAEVTAPCPPGVPLIMPGEIIDSECIEELRRNGVEEVLTVDN
ncbi:MAG: amino acid decarboxylase [Oscillospiraceae bacterium]|nr:amino acid decarboxylase [Oscillospiraceae bacterium]